MKQETKNKIAELQIKVAKMKEELTNDIYAI